MTTKTLTTVTTATLRGMPLKTTLHWTSEDPYAVRLMFASGEEWIVGRNPLTRELTGGLIVPQEQQAAEITVLRSSETTITITHYYWDLHPVSVTLPFSDVKTFIDGTYKIVGPNKEYTVIDWPAEFPGVTA